MAKVQEVAEKVYRFETPLAGLDQMFSVYLIKEAKAVLVDPGPAAAIPAIQEAMAALDVKNLAYIIPTHIHIDHAGGVGGLSQLFPQAKVVLHPRGAKHIIDPSRLIQGTKMVFGDDFETRYGSILPVPKSRVEIPEDGNVFSIGGRDIQIIYAPGHAPHHIVILDKKVNGLFCGEALGVPHGGERSFVMPAAAPPDFDVEVSLETMRKLGNLKPRILFYAHGGGVGEQPERIISEAAENTRMMTDVILGIIKAGSRSSEELGAGFQKYVEQNLGLKIGIHEAMMAANGYAMYLKKRM